MITKERIQKLIDEKLEGTDFFVVSLEVLPGNKIQVEMDGDNGFPISECVNFSRQIEHNLDREEEDFSLNVGSPGLTKPFKVQRQYAKNVGRNVKVKCADGTAVKGELLSVSNEGIVVKTTRKERVEGKKKKVEIVEEVSLSQVDILETKLVLDF